MRFISVLLFLLAAASSIGQSPPLTVDEAVTTAVKNNPRLSAAARNVGAARYGVRSARALAGPEILLTPGLSAGGSDEELLIRQSLEINGTRAARAGVAAAHLRRAQALAVVELRNLIAETKTAFYELARSRELHALESDLLRATEDFDRRIRRLVEEGRRPGIETAQTGIEVARAAQQVAQAAAQVSSAESALNTLMGIPAGQSVPVLAPLTFTPFEENEASLVRQALSSRAEIAAEDAQREAFRQEARLARAEGRPDLAPQFRAGSLFRGVSGVGLGIGITLPFLDYEARRNRIRQAEELARAQSDRTLAQQNQIRQEVQQALSRVRAAQTILTTYPQGVLPQARRLVEASRISLQEGQPNVTILNLLEAQRTYRNVLTEYTNALVSYAQAHAELERATGEIPERLLPEPRYRP